MLSTDRSLTKRSQIVANNKQADESQFDVSIDQITLSNFAGDQKKEGDEMLLESCSSLHSLSALKPKPRATDDLEQQLFL